MTVSYVQEVGNKPKLKTRKGTMPTAIQLDITVEDASNELAKNATSITGWVRNLKTNKRKIGALLNSIFAQGLIESAKNEVGARDFKVDGRKTEVGNWVAKNIKGMSRQQASEYRKLDRDFDILEDADIDTSQFAASAFKAMTKMTDTKASKAKFVRTVRKLVEDKDVETVTADIFNKAARLPKVGLVPPSKGDNEETDSFLKAQNAYAVALVKAIEDGRTISQNERNAFDAIRGNMLLLEAGFTTEDK